MILIPWIGIATAVLLVILWVDFVPGLPHGAASRYLEAAGSPEAKQRPGWRGWLEWLSPSTRRWAPKGLLSRARTDLYFAHLSDRWVDWDEALFFSLRIAAAVGALVMGLGLYNQLLLGLMAMFLGWQMPAVLLGGTARKIRRRFQTQLPEFVQLVAAQMAAGVSLEEALRRTSSTRSLVAEWVRHVLQIAQGRSVIEMFQREARSSGLGELVGLGVQLEFVARGTAQQELMQQMAERIAADFTAGAELRAEKVGAELVIPMVLFYFLPFIVIILVLIGWPIIQTIL
ncbi:MAG: hypothetical protein PHQ40_08700 [Anaerolineaceae bacterium]|nr:hypothetical protein [Anaerolineaceae bacterium]